MAQFPVSSPSERSIHAALEVSRNSWLLAVQVPGRDNPSRYPIRGGNAEGLMARLDAATDTVAKASPRPAIGWHGVAMIEAAWLWVRHQPE